MERHWLGGHPSLGYPLAAPSTFALEARSSRTFSSFTQPHCSLPMFHTTPSFLYVLSYDYALTADKTHEKGLVFEDALPGVQAGKRAGMSGMSLLLYQLFHVKFL